VKLRVKVIDSTKFWGMMISLNYKFLLTTGLILALLNCSINGFVAWFVWHEAAIVPIWGPWSVATHMLVSSMLVGFVIGYIATKITRRALRDRQVLPLHWHLKSQTFIDRLPSHSFARAFMLSLAAAIMAGIALMLLDLLKVRALPVNEFIIFKIIFAALLSGAVTVMAVYRAMGDTFMRQAKQN
jgi:hypothetical protein